jgi:hypothetical protein
LGSEHSERRKELEKTLGRVFAKLHAASSVRFATRQRDFVFHMLDWRSDMTRLSDLYDHPERFSSSEAVSVVQAFLYHASGHIAEAARLYDIFVDPFQAARPPTPTRSAAAGPKSVHDEQRRRIKRSDYRRK